MPATWLPESSPLHSSPLKCLIALLVIYYLSPAVEALGGQDEVGWAHYCIFGTQHRPWDFKGLDIC